MFDGLVDDNNDEVHLNDDQICLLFNTQSKLLFLEYADHKAAL